MPKEKFFDINMHLTANGMFKNYKRNMPCSLDTYMTFVDPSLEFIGGLIVGLPNVGGYCHQNLMEKSNRLHLPAFAAVTNECLQNLDVSFDEIKRMGFLGVKFHHRLLNLHRAESHLLRVAEACKKANLILAICTYQAEVASSEQDNLIFLAIEEICKMGVKIILMHAGGYRFLDFFDRFSVYETVLFDTSFSLKRYENTDIIESFADAIQKDNNNIAFGTDYPDYNLQDYSGILKSLTSCIQSKGLWERVMYKNAMNFLKLNE